MIQWWEDRDADRERLLRHLNAEDPWDGRRKGAWVRFWLAASVALNLGLAWALWWLVAG